MKFILNFLSSNSQNNNLKVCSNNHQLDWIEILKVLIPFIQGRRVTKLIQQNIKLRFTNFQNLVELFAKIQVSGKSKYNQVLNLMNLIQALKINFVRKAYLRLFHLQNGTSFNRLKSDSYSLLNDCVISKHIVTIWSHQNYCLSLVTKLLAEISFSGLI